MKIKRKAQQKRGELRLMNDLAPRVGYHSSHGARKLGKTVTNVVEGRKAWKKKRG
jgi:hypothetical protein